MSVKEEILKIIADNVHREGIKDLVNWLVQSDFFVAPASTKYHGDHEGGLAEHSLTVYKNLKAFSRIYYSMTGVKNWNPETLAIVALFHDLCKIGCYKTEMRWRKNSMNQWEQYPTYKFEEDFAFGGHGSKSVYLVQNFIKLTPDEAVAINCHMGAWDASTYSNPSSAYESCHLAWLLHIADEAASYVNRK